MHWKALASRDTIIEWHLHIETLRWFQRRHDGSHFFSLESSVLTGYFLQAKLYGIFFVDCIRRGWITSSQAFWRLSRVGNVYRSSANTCSCWPKCPFSNGFGWKLIPREGHVPNSMNGRKKNWDNKTIFYHIHMCKTIINTRVNHLHRRRRKS